MVDLPPSCRNYLRGSCYSILVHAGRAAVDSIYSVTQLRIEDHKRQHICVGTQGAIAVDTFLEGVLLNEEERRDVAGRLREKIRKKFGKR